MEAEIRREIDRAREVPDKPAWAPPVANLAQLLSERAQQAPERDFLVFCDDDRELVRRWTWADTRDAVARAAGLLRARGIGPGDRVAFLIGNLDHTILLYLATWSLGASVAPVNAAETRERKGFILDNSAARLLIARDTYLDEARDLVADRDVELIAVDEQDPGAYPALAAGAEPVDLASAEFPAAGTEALLVYTSGTTGPPKGVRIDQRNLMANASSMAGWHGWDERLRAMCVLPIHHVNGIVVTHLTPLYTGGTAILNARFHSGRFWERIASERATVASVVPTLLEFLLEAGDSAADRSSLETIVCGAGPLMVETALEFETRFGVPITHGYGLSETTCYNCHLPPDLEPDERRAWLGEHGFPSIGVALPDQELTILDAEGREPPDGARGEICVRGDSVSLGYHERDDANRESFHDGWFHSGDEGFALRDARERRFFFITGRIKELIIRGGVNYSPLEIDEVLNAHPDVRYGLAVPFANRYYGDEIAAYVVPREAAHFDPEGLLAFCRERLDFAKCPKVVVLGDEVPYTTTGKAKRLELAQSLAGRLAEYRAVQFRRR